MSSDVAAPKAAPSGPLRWLIPLVLFLCGAPAVYGLLHASGGARYIGFEYNTDDHMVYAAWMRQAMDFRFFMDNRFTVDQQPSLTVHVYFFLIGLVAKVVGIPTAATVARLGFDALFLLLLARFVKRLGLTGKGETLALVATVFGGGLGFLVWQMFDVSITKPAPDILKSLLNGQLPIDVWQPEAFIFPSMLTNGLFAVSLCLILTAYESFLSSKHSWKSAAVGFCALGVLMNIHSYDVLTIALVMVGFLGAICVRRQVSRDWVIRAIIAACGVIAPALWFMHVLHTDTVFQSRAATETYSPNFRAVLFGYLPLMLLGLFGAFYRAKSEADPAIAKRRLAGVAIAVVLILGLSVASSGMSSGFFMGAPVWVGAFVVAVAAAALWADENPAWSLVFSWATVGLIAIYFPGLFQRKLTMGLSVPWALLATQGLLAAVKKTEPSSRRLIAACATLLLSASSLLWLVRDVSFINQNVANTTRHPVYLDADLVKIIDILNGKRGRNVVLALPGSASPSADQEGHQIPDSFSTPNLPDIAPILSGFTGVYTYAGHWSETPDYGKHASDMYHYFLSAPFGGVKNVMDADARKQFVAQTGATYAVIPSTDKGLPITSADQLGKVEYAGPIWTLVDLKG